MINLTKLLYNQSSYGDELRYSPDTNPKNRRPVVVWNVSRRCNLSCIHCYSDSHNKKYPGELTTEEAERMICRLAEFKVPVLLFSGGEPLLRKDIFRLNRLAKKLNLRTVISTNGTLITKKLASRIKKEDFDYVGVSLDGIGSNNDRFRGCKGAFALALSGIRNLADVRQKVGLRFCLTRRNYPDLPGIFKLVEKENIDRVCFYHLVYTGRGSVMAQDDLTHQQTRSFLDALYDWALQLHKKGIRKEVLTVDNHADGPYIYLKLRKENPKRAAAALSLLRRNGGNSSGIAIANIDYRGFVHPDQFWQSYACGNVRKKSFGKIWLDKEDKLMSALRERKTHLKGRCAACGFLDVCNGNFRVRVLAVYNDVWQPDPACYLTDEEIKNKNIK
jgi:radical SAM protein with 4Fe4S-binding SPASM domain